MSKKKQNGKRTSSEMYPMMELYEESGMTQKQFCEEMDLVPHAFTYWLTKYRKSKRSIENTDLAGKFVELEVEAPKMKSKLLRYMRIKYPDGTLIEVQV
jgi:transposase-like protein